MITYSSEGKHYKIDHLDTPWNGRCVKFSDIQHRLGGTGLTFETFDTKEAMILKVVDEHSAYCFM